jgi:hypothetical protein
MSVLLAVGHKGYGVKVKGYPGVYSYREPPPEINSFEPDEQNWLRKAEAAQLTKGKGCFDNIIS